MEREKLLFTECHGCNSPTITYVETDKGDFKRVVPKKTIGGSIFQLIASFFTEILLPYGFPETVSQDYINYQFWDTIQAFCSTITASFTTRAILKSIGVGNAKASALSAAVTWIIKDGFGMLGRIWFAWWKGNVLDSDCKKWRMFADILNDYAMGIELFIINFADRHAITLCVTSAMKSVVGLVGGATRASISTHQAISNNMADISAKDGTQETLVNLLASVLSIYLLASITDPTIEQTFVLFLIILHLTSNYYAVKSLIFNHLNNARALLILQNYFETGIVDPPEVINKKESVFFGFGKNVKKLCGFDLNMGCSAKEIFKMSNSLNISKLIKEYENKPYLIYVDEKKLKISVVLEERIDSEQILQAYFDAFTLGLSRSIQNKKPMVFLLKDSSPISQLMTLLKDGNNATFLSSYFPTHLRSTFFNSLKRRGWTTATHSLNVGHWRCRWKEKKE